MKSVVKLAVVAMVALQCTTDAAPASQNLRAFWGGNGGGGGGGGGLVGNILQGAFGLVGNILGGLGGGGGGGGGGGNDVQPEWM